MPLFRSNYTSIPLESNHWLYLQNTTRIQPFLTTSSMSCWLKPLSSARITPIASWQVTPSRPSCPFIQYSTQQPSSQYVSMTPHLTQGKVNICTRPYIIRSLPWSLTMSFTPLLSSYSMSDTQASAILRTHQEHPPLGLCITIPSSLNAVLPDIDMASSFTSCSLLTEAFTSILLWSYPHSLLYFSLLLLSPLKYYVFCLFVCLLSVIPPPQNASSVGAGTSVYFAHCCIPPWPD